MSNLRFGVLHTYFTRHGVGPFVTEDGELNSKLSEHHNATSRWQGHFRKSWFAFVATRYALEITDGVDGLAITHIDYLDRLDNWKVCAAYQIGIERLNIERASKFVIIRVIRILLA